MKTTRLFVPAKSTASKKATSGAEMTGDLMSSGRNIKPSAFRIDEEDLDDEVEETASQANMKVEQILNLQTSRFDVVKKSLDKKRE